MTTTKPGYGCLESLTPAEARDTRLVERLCTVLSQVYNDQASSNRKLVEDGYDFADRVRDAESILPAYKFFDI